MGLGYRVFFVQDEHVQRIAQKRFNSLYLKKTEPLTQYANKTVISVLAMYELVDRKPDTIVRIDTQKIRFNADGFVDEAYEDEGRRLVASKMDDVFSGLLQISGKDKLNENKNADESVVDASKRFDDRRWKQRHPELSGPVLKKILNGIFGSKSRRKTT